MPFVPVPKDLSKIKTKHGGLTKRQWICFAPAMILVPLTYISLYFWIGIDETIALACAIILGGPFVIAGVYERRNLTLEQYIATMLRSNYWYPAKRYKKGLKGGSEFETVKDRATSRNKENDRTEV